MPDFVRVAFDMPGVSEFSYRKDPGGLARVGVRVEASLGRRMSVGWVVAEEERVPFDPSLAKPISRVLDGEALFDPDTVELARWVSRMYFCSLGTAISGILPQALRERPAEDEGHGLARSPKDLNAEQRAALDRVLESPGVYYLHGITGSGKTEVFLQAAEETLRRGLGVLYLVPEIALTTQVVEDAKARFGEACAVLHSGLTPARRLAEWRKVLKGEARVVVGARSAAFAPVRSLGLIVVDEEHEGSYKSSQSPRYHARQVAMRRAADAGARLVMGSATPSAEAWSLMGEGRMARLSLSSRPGGGTLPEIEVIDMRGKSGPLSARLVEELRACKAAGRQSVLFLNRRGFSYFFRCASCGAEMSCKHCSVPLTYHKDRDSLVCHYCGFRRPPPRSCPECGSLDVGWAGFGTERVEEEALAAVPGLRIARVDADSTSKRGELARVLSAFRAGEIDCLLGTQMVAKGIDVPGVSLVGIVLADTAMNLPDFRAAERAFALVTQAAGRAGRHSSGALVLVQTFRPDSPVIRFARDHDLEGFYAHELAIRRELGFPPYARLIRLVFRSKRKDLADAGARDFAQLLKPALPEGAELLGPSECAVGMVAETHRVHILVRAATMGVAHAAVGDALSRFKPPSALHVEVDVDPVSMM
jgi:primosomal protein N' (replication factor Y)